MCTYRFSMLKNESNKCIGVGRFERNCRTEDPICLINRVLRQRQNRSRVVMGLGCLPRTAEVYAGVQWKLREKSPVGNSHTE